jgi:hypothetical protein
MARSSARKYRSAEPRRFAHALHINKRGSISVAVGAKFTTPYRPILAYDARSGKGMSSATRGAVPKTVVFPSVREKA